MRRMLRVLLHGTEGIASLWLRLNFSSSNTGYSLSPTKNGVAPISKPQWNVKGMPWCCAWCPGYILLAAVVRLARHHYHVVVLLSQSCLPSAILVAERLDTCSLLL